MLLSYLVFRIYVFPPTHTQSNAPTHAHVHTQMKKYIHDLTFLTSKYNFSTLDNTVRLINRCCNNITKSHTRVLLLTVECQREATRNNARYRDSTSLRRQHPTHLWRRGRRARRWDYTSRAWSTGAQRPKLLTVAARKVRVAGGTWWGERGGICREWKILDSVVERSLCKSAMTQLLPQEREDVEERGGDWRPTCVLFVSSASVVSKWIYRTA